MVILTTGFSLLMQAQTVNKFEKSKLMGREWVAQLSEEYGISLSLTFMKDSVVQKFGHGDEAITLTYGYYLSDKFDMTDFNWNLIGAETAGDCINMNRREKVFGVTRQDAGFLKIVSLTDDTMVLEYKDMDSQIEFRAVTAWK